MKPRQVLPLSHKRVINTVINLAPVYHFRKQGVYQLRVRPLGSLNACTVSLRSTNRAEAMASSEQLQTLLRHYHLDNPEASWPDLRKQLRTLAESLLGQSASSWEELDALALLSRESAGQVRSLSRHGPLSASQARAMGELGGILYAGERRFLGQPEVLAGFIDRFDQEEISDRQRQASLSLSVGTPSVAFEPITFETLSADYLREHSANLKENSLIQMGYEYKTISETLNGLDLRTHTRDDMVSLRTSLLQERAASTVNNLLSKLSTVMEWAVNNQLIPYARTKGLKIKRDAESKREAFTQVQVQAIMDKAASLGEDDWLRWALSLGAITGARVGELLHLTKNDIREHGGVVFIDINGEGGKDLKNSYSARWVPLTDGAYGSFDLAAFRRYIKSHQKRNALGVSHVYAKKVLNQTVQEVAGSTNGTLTFHSLRHSIAGHLKSKGTPLETVQAITGHSSGSITYDHYGAEGRVELGILAEALRKALVPGEVS